MLRNVLAKSLRDQRRKAVWWSLGLALFALMTTSIYPSYSSTASELERFMERAPAALRAFFGGTDLGTPAGYLHTEVFSFMAPLMLILFAVALGTRMIAGEERRGTLDLLLSAPLSRRRLAGEKFLAMILATLGIATVFWAVLAAGSAIFSMEIGLGELAQTMLSCALLAFVFGALAFALGAGTGSTAVATGATAAVGVGSYLLDGLAPVVGGLRPYQVLSPFHYFFDAQPLRNGVDPVHAAILVAMTTVLFGVSLLLIDRRDLGT
ncbi:MAG: ABC transporter permease subunit [Actinomycetota bacterium]